MEFSSTVYHGVLRGQLVTTSGSARQYQSPFKSFRAQSKLEDLPLKWSLFQQKCAIMYAYPF